RRVGAGEVGGAAGVDVQGAAAGALQPLFDSLDEFVVLGGRHPLAGASGRDRIPQGARLPLPRKLPFLLGRGRGRPDAGERRRRRRGAPEPAQEAPPVDGHVAGPAVPASCTSYPACRGRGAAPPVPPGHIVMRPPTTRTTPPIHTQMTSGLMVKR